ncbi:MULTISPECIES: RcnB family protein [Xanthomonas]|uniref:RcnB family protein n=1 Tax=Xanthomonas phaseoli pv. dieffenbachiae TaxID=92828 RepID=A0A1V9HF58_9XANT|nr:RcnB family protein [Xanthomonas phaseoli]MBO9767257.1 RcnB family protein [Xanthomonas phaseoli pv. dieffenbachiae]MBO9775026.1 RcnB family protein [Xanthomonas phaseoli pv. dieffenbachiae]MBO9779337.1 RcnB family protein [Xanthomonas phaseoli pv. dieffenbachiae]MBO9786466.1 RcnB family protein [Xanthomonas phaseoli pv. dieffenbachiae]MBO9795539.1 RcnB family protein [Xanthomonas phaseoli pv. dieffenbachiae]
MNRKRIVTVVLSSILALGAFAPAAFAGDWDRDHDRRGPDRHHVHDRRDWRDDRRDDRREWRQDRRYYSNGYREGYRDARYQDRRYDRNRVYVYDRPAYYRAGPPPRPYWARGQRYHGPVYVVNDYDRYDLRRPPYGYRWQRDDRGNLLLVAIATGIIADLVLNN